MFIPFPKANEISRLGFELTTMISQFSMLTIKPRKLPIKRRAFVIGLMVIVFTNGQGDWGSNQG